MAKKKKGYNKGGVLGTSEYGKKPKYKKGGVIGTASYGKAPKYEDGGIVGDAKRNALMDLKAKMTGMGGDSLISSLSNKGENAYKDGGVVKASVIAKDEKGLKEGLKKASKILNQKYEDGGVVESNEEFESGDDFADLSKEELIELLRNS